MQQCVDISFERGDPVALDDETLSPTALRQARDRVARSRREPLCRHEVA
jgi:argininosuccinate synthase